MNSFRVAFCALLFAGAAFARPVVLEEVATLSPPDPSWQDLGNSGVAIDGDFALVSAQRSFPDASEESGIRVEMAAFVYQRSGTNWNYTGQLGPIFARHDRSTPGLAMKGGIAIVALGPARIYERVGTTWTEAALPPETHLVGDDVEIDAGRILISTGECNPTAAILHKINGQWAVEGELEGWSRGCDHAPSNNQQDIQGEFAVVHDPETDSFTPVPPRVRQYRRNENGIGWHQFGGFDSNGAVGDIYHPDVALAGPYIAMTGTREWGTRIAYRATEAADPAYALATTGLQAPDSYLQTDAWSATASNEWGASSPSATTASIARRTFSIYSASTPTKPTPTNSSRRCRRNPACQSATTSTPAATTSSSVTDISPETGTRGSGSINCRRVSNNRRAGA